MNNKAILSRMKALGLNTSVLADKTGLSISTINKIVYGITNNPTISNLQAIAKVLDCKVDDFIDEPSADFYKPKLMAAHHDEPTWTDEELAEIEEFKKYVLSKRKK